MAELGQHPARADIEAALRKQAARTAVDLIKERARAYAKCTMALENVFSGLSAAAPEAIIAVAKHLIAAERNAPRRWFGFGGRAPAFSGRAISALHELGNSNLLKSSRAWPIF